jgi:ligand-binding sensor domain-containing protein
MTVHFIAICLILVWTSGVICAEDKNVDRDTEQNGISLDGVSDTLKFTKGIRSIFQDSKGNYWFGSDQEGVCKYDGKTFTYYTTQQGFCGSQVISIQEDETGVVWFGTSTDLCSYDGKKFNSINHTLSVSSRSLKTTDIWFAGNRTDEIIRIDRGKIFRIKNPIRIPVNSNPMNYGITGFTKGKNGDIWIAYYAGVLHYNGKTIEYINDSTMNLDGDSEYIHVRSVLKDSQGRLWIGNNGIGVLLKEGDSIYNFSRKHNLFQGKIFGLKSPAGTLMHVFAIKEDSKGNIWFGDRDTGAWRFDGKGIKNFVIDSTLNTQHIWHIYEDKSGNLLFAMGDKGVYRFNGSRFDRIL